LPDPLSLPRVVIVTGTGTEVGKTVATAALAVLLRARGSRVVVVKPTQTGGYAGEPGDVDWVRSRVGTNGGVEFAELVRLRDPLAPDAAARREGVALPSVAQHARTIGDLAQSADVVLVEGAGGLLVRLDGQGRTLADLGAALRYQGVSTGFVVVATASLGTLNVTALTAEALRTRGLPLLGVLIGSWPAQPGLAESSNLEDLPNVAEAPLLGRLPEGAGRLSPEDFRAGVPSWLAFT
jgi:dethiobiotin synthetase